jgi:hypothetical protein
MDAHPCVIAASGISSASVLHSTAAIIIAREIVMQRMEIKHCVIPQEAVNQCQWEQQTTSNRKALQTLCAPYAHPEEIDTL